ncbi:uncharacterized protein LOC119070430 [Bradysia coprophila]|uniref:uncharacterized protein LOC119070430 n=1 Tax=Bradysia coprophila TaxID=38358 RepID=UPI00187DC47F|nr:uncharacterized protein LOC119070430 [Bradysia coprophila]XP_037030667.1 uncharacterized protein LOC119070430 [Bradysia coprophila]XP_037030668.1 uncharacterized protein LOC119070430 [Bradysia coprophila]
MSLIKRITVTYGTFVTANYLSNHILFPDKKLDYGFLNRLIGREVNTEWWGTRSAHIFTIGIPLAIADHLSIDLWNKVLIPRMKYPAGTKLSIAKTPGPFLFHAVTFAFTGIMTYIAWDSYANPYHKERVQAFTSKAYPELQGCQSMYMLPLMSGAVEYLSGRPCPHGTLLGLIPPTCAFVTVKGFGMKWPWNDNLTNFERKLNAEK